MANENEKAEHSDEANKSNELKEYKRWKDYANALLLAFSILSAGITIGGHKGGWWAASGICGLAGIICVVVWYSRDPPVQWGNWPAFLRGRPKFLVFASMLIAAQACSLGKLLW